MRAAPLVLFLTLAGAALGGDGPARLSGHGGPIQGIAVEHGGDRALTASFDYALGLWELDRGRLVRWLEGHEAAVNDAAFLPGGRRAVSAGDDFDLILWDLVTGDPIRRFEGHEGKILAAAVSPDGATIASAGWDGRVGLWDVESGERRRWLDGHRGPVNDVAFAEGGAILYSASHDGTIRRWRVAGGEEVGIEVSHGFGVNEMALNEAAGWMAYGAVDGVTRAFALADGEEIADLTLERRPILALALGPEGGRLAVGDGDGYIMVVDTRDWTVVHDFRAAETGPIWALAFADDGAILAGGLDSAAAYWRVGADAGALFAEAQPFQRPPGAMANGERQFVRKCSVCHSLGTDRGRKAGPPLGGLFGRKAGAVQAFQYSPALARSDIVWSAETIDALFAQGPAHYTPGSKMPMQRIAGAEDRRDLIAYLKAMTEIEGGSEE